ncbi:N-acyltransferase YncA [Corynebacterium capitovis DSM 44611]|uniref:ribosomal protein S18-alanine N-acetyltransferase n=1 Tax=Corynebacterium capitovis TaxID=131081 RepID=UPI00037D74EE|nr:ribosomal protein S18-alanine N-acetyltransferase [Corynebacterium capitovis]WKD56921.1 N-acyltransferase YncA [Corynebacterium capitovis DSM 44611]
MKLRELRIADATRVAEIEAVLFAGDSPWPRTVFAAELAQPYTFYVGAFTGEDDDELIGYAGVAKLGPRDDPEFEVHTIGVDPSHQGKGVGRILMDQLVHAADQYDAPMFLEVRTDNIPARRMYESYGFFTLATRKNYYQPSGADAFSMMRHRASERATS